MRAGRARLGAELHMPAGLLAGIADLEAAYATWRAQAEWHVSEATGDDAATGADAAHKIKTWGELRRRMGGGLQGSSTIYVYDALPSGSVVIDWGSTGTVNVIGTTALVRAGTATAAPQTRAPATSLPNELTDATVADWTADIKAGRYITFVDGPAAGAVAWVAKNLGANKARVSTYLSDFWVESNPANGNAYQVRALCAVGTAIVAPTAGYWNFDLFQMSTTVASTAGAALCAFRYCELDWTSAVALDVQFYNCVVSTAFGYFAEAAVAIIDAGVVFAATVPSPRVTDGAEVQLDLGVLHQACGPVEVRHAGTLNCVDAGFFDSTGDAILVRRNGFAKLDTCWGSGNAGYGVKLSGVATCSAGAGCTVTGTGGDIKIGSLAVKTWAALAATGYYATDTGVSACTASPTTS